jgi:hypothetical protein
MTLLSNVADLHQEFFFIEKAHSKYSHSEYFESCWLKIDLKDARPFEKVSRIGGASLTASE